MALTARRPDGCEINSCEWAGPSPPCGVPIPDPGRCSPCRQCLSPPERHHNVFPASLDLGTRIGLRSRAPACARLSTVFHEPKRPCDEHPVNGSGWRGAGNGPCWLWVGKGWALDARSVKKNIILGQHHQYPLVRHIRGFSGTRLGQQVESDTGGMWERVLTGHGVILLAGWLAGVPVVLAQVTMTGSVVDGTASLSTFLVVQHFGNTDLASPVASFVNLEVG